MIILGDQTSGEILRQLDEDEVQAHRPRNRADHQHHQRASRAILEEFYQMSVARDFVLKGGVDFAKKMLMNGIRSGTRHGK